MKKFFSLFFVLVIVLSYSLTFAAGTCTQNTISVNKQLNETTFTCTGDSSDGTFPSTASNSDIDGWILAVKTNPGTAPTAAYDIVLNDSDGIDVMGGALADRSASVSEEAIPSKSGIVKGPITVVITNNSQASAVVVLKIYSYKP
jgi:hypothetical protein